MRVLLIAILNCLTFTVSAQTFDWWAQNVKWDGVTHWTQYIITQPGYMGPNALPVPRISNGSIDSTFSISATGALHFSKGDNTQNITLYANYCLVKNLISIDAVWIPYEHYTMSHEIKTERHVFSHFYYDQQATGDICINTNIQLLNKWRKYIHLALRIGYRFPTSSGVGSARYTDAPGYYFDLSYAKSFPNSAVKWIGMLGFYSWQMISDKFFQDDAFLFGSGIEWNKKTFRLQTYIGGYIGYLKNKGDAPIIARLNAEKKFKLISLLLNYQQGLHDFKYSSLEMGMKYTLK